MPFLITCSEVKFKINHFVPPYFTGYMEIILPAISYTTLIHFSPFVPITLPKLHMIIYESVLVPFGTGFPLSIAVLTQFLIVLWLVVLNLANPHCVCQMFALQKI